MAFDAQKTLLLEKQYLYVRASKGFTLEGTSTERIWTNTGYYRFLVDNVARSIGNSYVTIHYDSSDLDFIAYCSDLFLEEIQNSVTAAVENIESVVEDFSDRNHDDIDTLSQGLSSALQTISNNVSDFKSANHTDISSIGTTLSESLEALVKGVNAYDFSHRVYGSIPFNGGQKYPTGSIGLHNLVLNPHCAIVGYNNSSGITESLIVISQTAETDNVTGKKYYYHAHLRFIASNYPLEFYRPVSSNVKEELSPFIQDFVLGNNVQNSMIGVRLPPNTDFLMFIDFILTETT